MIIKTSISFHEYLKLLYGLTYRKPVMIAILCVALAMVLWITGYYEHFLPVPKPTYYQYLTIILITVVQPIAIYGTIWRNYYSSNHLRESLEIDVSQTEIKIKGDSFYTELTWQKMFKVVEQEHWFLIYQNNLSAIIIPKKDFPGNKIIEFKNILRTIAGVPIDLKKTS